MEGTQIGSYRIERKLGEGGFGVVYVAMDTRLGRRAAIKQLLPELSGHRDIVERFFNEAKAAASINHPGIVEIYDVGWHTDGSAYFAMKLLEGDSLAKRLREAGPLPIQIATTIARQVSSALVAAHARGIVHRDLKPDNIVLVADDEVAIGERATVLDFGIAKLFGDKPASQKTRTGMMMGTPSYMSPEQCRGAGEVDHRTDVYALGCILFEMLTGRAPFVAEGAGEVLGMHQFVDAPTVRSLRPDVPAELDALVTRMLAKKPEHRLAQMSELTLALQPFATGGRSMERRAVVPSPASSHPGLAPTMASDPGMTAPSAIHAAGVARAAVANELVPAQPVAQSTYSAGRGGVAVPPPSASSKRGLIIGLGAVVAVGGVVAVVIASSSGSATTAAAPGDAGSLIAGVERDANVAAALPIDAETIVRASPDAPDVPPDAAVASAPRDAAVAKPVPPPVPFPVVASLDRNVIRNKMRDNLARFRYCYEKELAIKPGLAGTVLASFTVKPDGSVDEATATGVDPNVASCVARVLATLRFPKGGGDVKVNYPFAFQEEGKHAGSSVPVESPACDADDLKAKGQELASSGAHASALQKFKQSLACRPDPQVVKLAYLAACNANNAGEAKAQFRKLPAAVQNTFSQACLRHGIDPTQ